MRQGQKWTMFFSENYDPAVLLCIEYQRFEFEFVALKFGDQMDSFSRQQRRGSGGFM